MTDPVEPPPSDVPLPLDPAPRARPSYRTISVAILLRCPPEEVRSLIVTVRQLTERVDGRLVRVEKSTNGRLWISKTPPPMVEEIQSP